MGQRATTEERGKLSDQLHELYRMVKDGVRPYGDVRQPLQQIIDGQFSDGKLYQAFSPPLSWFVSPEVQLANVRRWNEEQGWGFADGDFPAQIPDFTPSSPLEVMVLAVYLPDTGRGKRHVPGYVRTANELWQIARDLQPNWRQWDNLHLEAEHLQLLKSIEDTHVPGICWTAVDLGANWDKQEVVRPCDVRGNDSAHAEVLAAAAHFPNWIQAMDGTNVPYVWLAGYQVWTHVPILYWNGSRSEVNLGISLGGNHDRSFGVPVRRELPACR